MFADSLSPFPESAASAGHQVDGPVRRFAAFVGWDGRRSIREAMGPRDPAEARLVVARMLLIAAAVTGLFGLVDPPPGRVNVLAGLAVSVALVVMALIVRRPSGIGPSVVATAAPVIGVLLVCALDLDTSDASAAGQVFFCFPVLYGASQLRPLGAYAALLAGLGADAVAAFALLPPARALTDVTYVGVTLVMMTVLLVGAGQRQETLTAELRRRAATDPLTGLVTRRVLDEAAQTALASATNNGGTVLILTDIDHFKTINDRYGHPVGDAALVHVADILSTHSRPQDVVSRLGGDEIALLLPGCPAHLGRQRAEAIAAAVAATPMPTSGGPIEISVSVGVAHSPGDGPDLRTLYAHADQVLYDAKRNGRGRVGRAVTPTATAAPRA